MTGSKQEDSKLNLDRGLGNVRIVVEDVVVTDLVDDGVEGVGVNAYLFPVLIKVAVTPVFEKVELRCFFDGWVLAKNP